MRHTRLALSLALLLGSVHAVFASPRDSIVVNSAWLAAHLNDPDLVVLHVGDKKEYDERHIPGARFVSMRDVAADEATSKGLSLEMPLAEELRQKLEALGISDNSRVVVYYGKDWVSPSTRIVFTLDYAGLGGRSALLDGGMDAWVREGHPTTALVPGAKKGSLSPLKIHSIVVDADYVRSHIGKPGTAVIDGRAAVYYDGTEEGGPKDHRKRGHVAGAKSVPFTEITNDQLQLKSPSELEALFAAAGVKPGDTVVGYCHIGQQATAMLFGARLLGHPVLLYDGSFEDWVRRDLPVEDPSAASRK